VVGRYVELRGLAVPHLDQVGLSVVTHARHYMRMSAYDLPEDDHVDLAVEVFRMLADATRLRLLWLLRDGEATVGELTEGLRKPQALVSQHLAKLRMARLVGTRRQGSYVYYRIANEHVAQLVVDGIFNAEHAGAGVPAHHQRGGAPS
jgi:ArsR family transcriptional regulator, zinc-responsive transcriptional repressor